jgi:hypothetical protein
MKFLVHGVMNHVLLRQRGFGLARSKSALFVGTFYSHTLVWLPKVTKRTCLGMKLNPQVF